MPRKRNKPLSSELPPTPQQCPNCGNKKLVLHGAVCRAVEQDVENGQPNGELVVRDAEEDVVWDRISCSTCGAQLERTDQRIAELREEIEQLRYQLAFVTGRLVPENRLPC